MRLASRIINAIRRRKRSRKIEALFSNAYRDNAWHGEQSRSGTGSDLTQTATLRAELPKLFDRLNVRTVLDAPCGDFNWMRHVDLRKVDYIGADIVREIIDKNNAEHGDSNIRFLKMNLMTDVPPKVDLVLCRDCLVHFSYDDIRSALRNVAASGSRYLLTTTFADRPANEDIKTGHWRVLNLQKAPFNFPAPLEIINENCTENDGVYSDKSLGLWKLDALRPMQ